MKSIQSIFLFFLLLSAGQSVAQNVEVKGRLVDAVSQSPLIGANVSLLSTADSTKRFGVVADSLGGFVVKDVPKDNYRLVASLAGYLSYTQQINLASVSPDLGKIQINPIEPVLKNEAKKDTVIKVATATVEQKSDTLIAKTSTPAPILPTNTSTAPARSGQVRTQGNGQRATGGVEVKGRLVDANDQSPLIGANVLLINSADSTIRYGVVADTSGIFIFRNIPAESYRIFASFIGYFPYDQRINLRRVSPDLGKIQLKPDAQLLKDVIVKGVADRVEKKGDRVIYNASAFKVNKDANAQDLLEKMPNITIENGQVKAQGENEAQKFKPLMDTK